MQHVRPGSSISSSICFRSEVFVTTCPFSLVCNQDATKSLSYEAVLCEKLQILQTKATNIKVKKCKETTCTVMPRVPRAFCLMAIAIRFFSALVSLRAASIFRFTSLCSLSASKRFSARVPMPSSLDTCSSLCKLVIESVPIST